MYYKKQNCHCKRGPKFRTMHAYKHFFLLMCSACRRGPKLRPMRTCIHFHTVHHVMHDVLCLYANNGDDDISR